jgi:hypothetical protein
LASQISIVSRPETTGVWKTIPVLWALSTGHALFGGQ